MTLRTGHGNGAGQPRIEVLPADELPRPVAGPEPVPNPPVRRNASGNFADQEAAKEAGRRGGKARAKRLRLIDELGLKGVVEGNAFHSHYMAGKEYLRAERAALARVAGGMLSPGPSSILSSAALQLAFSRLVAEKAVQENNVELMLKASRLMNESRQNHLAAYELAVREAQARPAGDPLASFMPVDGDEDPSAPKLPPAIDVKDE